MVTIRPVNMASPDPSRSPTLASRLSKLDIATLNVRNAGGAPRVPIPSHGGVPPTKRRPWESMYRELPWAERRSRLVDAILSHGQPDLIGFQEVLYDQLLDLEQLLGPTYAHVGVGRGDGKQADEYSCIFYDQTAFDQVETGHFWLSETPDTPGSIGWDADQTRIATLLTLRAKVSGEMIHVVNTHYDHIGVRARAESSLLIRERVYQWVKKQEGAAFGRTSAAVILMGDFNSPMEEEGYKNITSSSALATGKPSFSFLDSLTHLSLRHSSLAALRQSGAYGPYNTFTGFEAPRHKDQSRIDFVMLASAQEPRSDSTATEDHSGKARGGWQATRFAVIDNFVEDDMDGWEGRWSDHRAVRVTISLV